MTDPTTPEQPVDGPRPVERMSAAFRELGAFNGDAMLTAPDIRPPLTLTGRLYGARGHGLPATLVITAALPGAMERLSQAISSFTQSFTGAAELHDRLRKAEVWDRRDRIRARRRRARRKGKA